MVVCACASEPSLPCATDVTDAPAPAAATCRDQCGGDDAPACPDTCGTPLELEWSVTLSTGSCVRSPVLAADVPGWIVVGGTAEHVDGDQAWTAGVDAEGCALWEDRDGEGRPLARFSMVRAVVGRADVGYYTVGVEGGGQDFDRLGTPWVRRYLPNQDVAWTWRESTAMPQTLSGVAVTPEGGALVAGGAQTTIDARGVLRRFTDDGEVSDAWWLGDALDSQFVDVVVSDSGRTWASLRLRDGSTHNGGFGEVVARSFQWLGADDAAGEITRLALAADDSIVAIQIPYPGARELYVSRWAATGERLWATQGAGYDRVYPRRVTALADGRTVVVGDGWDPQANRSEPIVLVFTSAGSLTSIQALPDLEGGHASDVAEAPDGAVYLTGLTEVCDVWVARVRG